MTKTLKRTILKAIDFAPDWVHRHLDSTDSVERIRARELLAQLIAEAVAKHSGEDVRDK